MFSPHLRHSRGFISKTSFIQRAKEAEAFVGSLSGSSSIGLRELFPLIWIVLIVFWVLLIPCKALFRAFKATKQKSFKNYISYIFESGFFRLHFFSVLTLTVLITLITTTHLESYFIFRLAYICGVVSLVLLLASWSNFDVVCCGLLLMVTAGYLIVLSGDRDGPRGMGQAAYFLKKDTSKESCYLLAGMVNGMSPPELYLDERESYGNGEACKLSIAELKELFKDNNYKIKILETRWWSHKENRHINEERTLYVSPSELCGCQPSTEVIRAYIPGFYNFEKQASTGLSYLDFYHYYWFSCHDFCANPK